MNGHSNREQAILDAARRIGSLQERVAYLKAACGADENLRRRVEDLLQTQEATVAGPEPPATPALFLPKEVLDSAVQSEQPGEAIGRYKLLQKIGEGGYGIVYMAEQEEPVRRRVALKVIKLGMDTRQVIARFEAERQALALMEHPNIAKVLDAGATEAGRPYFVMELVRGVRITDYCDQNNLSTPERLDLFVQVCHAIQHAHQKGIIHRDIKPSNILVTLQEGAPVPKVIDFGIAKATEQRLTDKTLFTELGAFIGTPAYMSPEQAEMSSLDIDTRSDIYSLGVLLYELLTGQTPFDPKLLLEAGVDEMRRKIREDEPLRPSTRLGMLAAAEQTTVSKRRRSEPPKLISLLRGDLDWIVMKCLEKSRTRRYETANGLAMDIQRHLQSEPVGARPPSTAYRFQRLVRRNRLAFAAVGAVAAALVIGLGVSTYLFIRERIARQRAVTAEQAQFHLREDAETARGNESLQRQRAERAVTRLEIERAENFFASDNSGQALALLASLLREQPTNRVVAERLLGALTHRSWCLPVAALPHDPALKTGQTNRPSLPGFALNGVCVRGGQFSPDGQRMVTWAKDGTSRLWDAANGQPIGTRLEHKDWVMSAEFSPDGQRLVTASLDQTARVWDTRTGLAVTAALPHAGPVLYAVFTPGGQSVRTYCRNGTIRDWSAGSGQPLTEPATNRRSIYHASFSRDGSRFLTMSEDGYMKVLDSQTGLMLTHLVNNLDFRSSAPFPQLSPEGDRVIVLDGDTVSLWGTTNRTRLSRFPHDFTVLSARFSPDGQLVATASMDNTVRLWETRAGIPLKGILPHDDWAMWVDFDALGHHLVTCSKGGVVRIWNVETGRPASEPFRHQSRMWQARCSPDGRRVLAIPNEEAAWLWEARPNLASHELFRHEKDVRLATFSPDGRRIATASWDGTARVWDCRTGKPLTEPLNQGGGLRHVQFSPGGDRLVTCSLNHHRARIWDATTGATLTSLNHSNGIYSARFSPDGKRVVTASHDRTAIIWEAATGQPMTRLEHPHRVFYAGFSPDGRWVVTASGDDTARVWNAHTGEPATEPLRHDWDVFWAEFSPDSRRVVTASHDKTARIWDARTGRQLARTMTHANELYDEHSVQFSPDGRWVATASGNAAQVWDAETGDPVTLPIKHDGRVNSVRFSPDGRHLATACYDGTARIWDAATGHAVSEPLRHDARVQYAEFSPDGRRLLTASTDGTARVWDVPAAPLPVPDWLADLAEGVAGQRLDARGMVEVVTVEQLLKLRRRLSAMETPGPAAGAGAPSAEGYGQWLKWFLSESATRTLSPSSALRASEVAERRLEENSLVSLREAVQLAPTNGLALARLARRLVSEGLDKNPRHAGQAEWYSALAVEFAPKNPEVWSLRAQILNSVGKASGALTAIDRAIDLTPSEAVFWCVKAEILEKLGQFEQAERACTKAIQLAESRAPAPEPLRVRALLKRSQVLKAMGRVADAQADMFMARGILPRDPQVPPNLIDLSDYYNVGLKEDWHGIKNWSLAPVPSGLQTLVGVKWDVRGFIQLKGLALTDRENRYPEQITGIKIAMPCRRLHFLHATGWHLESGRQIGSYVIHYADGQRHEIPIEYDHDVWNWTRNESPKRQLTRATVAWSGKNTVWGWTVELYRRTWDNPRPEMEIKSIDFVSSMTDCAPFLIALTADP